VPVSGIGFAFKGAIGRVDIEHEKLTVGVAAIGFWRVRGGEQTSSMSLAISFPRMTGFTQRNNGLG
jgi:hypothetical protein